MKTFEERGLDSPFRRVSMNNLTQKQEHCFRLLNGVADPLLNEFGYDEVYSTSEYRQNPSKGGQMVTLTKKEVMFVGRKETVKYTLFSEVRMDVESELLKIRAILEGEGRVRIRTKWVKSTLNDSAPYIKGIEEALWKAFKRDQLELDCT